MSISTMLQAVSGGYGPATAQEFADNPIAIFLRRSAPEEILKAIPVDARPGLKIKGSAGAGQWAMVPWVAVMDSIATSAPTAGYYIVYLFDAQSGRIFLSLNQGATKVVEEFGSRARAILKERAQLMRLRLPEFSGRFNSTDISFASEAGPPGDYAAGHGLGRTYLASALPSETQLVDDLDTLIRAYRTLTFRGGLDYVDDAGQGDTNTGSGSIEEIRRYRLHRRIERNPKASKEVKAYHGYICQVCEFDFEGTYGALGKEYIEAHHLKQLASLEEGKAMLFDIAKEFAVLCANCHRMIHRMADVSDLDALKDLLKTH